MEGNIDTIELCVAIYQQRKNKDQLRLLIDYAKDSWGGVYDTYSGKTGFKKLLQDVQKSKFGTVLIFESLELTKEQRQELKKYLDIVTYVPS